LDTGVISQKEFRWSQPAKNLGGTARQRITEILSAYGGNSEIKKAPSQKFIDALRVLNF
jgi:hypothetical protein